MNISIDKIKEDFAKRINEAMDSQGYPLRGRARVLSKQFDLSDKGAGKWLKGESIPETSKIPLIAEFLNVNAEWLISGNGDISPSTKSSEIIDKNVGNQFPVAGRLVPLISWVQAGAWTTVDAIPDGISFEEWLPPNPKCGKNGYGLEVIGESMQPFFMPTDKIYVNPDFQVSDLKTGDLVIVSCDEGKETTFKKLIIESGRMYLQPLNPNWPEKTIVLTTGCKLVGKVIGLYRDV